MRGADSDASVQRGRDFWNGGKWATEQLIKALNRGEQFTPDVLRTCETLQNEEWKAFDTNIVTGAQDKLRLVADLVGAGLTIPLPNAMAKTVFEYDLMGDMNPATVSMDGMARSENDTLEFESAGLPIPLIHKDFFINLRKLSASRLGAVPLDTTQSRVAGRKVGEELERMTINGGKTFLQLPIYGFLTHPNRNTSGFNGGKPWSDLTKTGDSFIADIGVGMSALQADGFDGPYWVYYPSNASVHLQDDFKAASDKTIIQRVREMDGITKVSPLDKLPVNTLLMFQPTSDVAAILDGIQPQTIQWDVNGGFGVNFKAFAIQIPVIRADGDGNSGIMHFA